MEQTTEAQEIAHRLRRRDVAVVHQLVERYQCRLMRYLLYLTPNQELAGDLFQETWLRVLERGSQFDGRSAFEPWLFSIAHNLAIDHFRKQAKILVERHDANTDSLATGISDRDSPSPFELAARSEDAQRLAKALLLLAPIYREVLVLRFQEQLSLQEIVRVVGAPVATVSSRIRRGLATLRSYFEAAKGSTHAG